MGLGEVPSYARTSALNRNETPVIGVGMDVEPSVKNDESRNSITLRYAMLEPIELKVVPPGVNAM